MNNLIEIGKKRTIFISTSILLISLWSIYFEQASNDNIIYTKLVRQIIRLILTFGLLYAVYIGKNWARITLIILFGLAILLAIIAIFTVKAEIFLKIPFFVMIFIYGISIYHFAFSKNFKEFFNFQKKKMRKEAEMLLFYLKPRRNTGSNSKTIFGKIIVLHEK